VLDVLVDGQLIFSKKQVGRWPELKEVLEKIPATT
jgi:Rdx family protein